jgi:hypothetical protein
MKKLSTILGFIVLATQVIAEPSDKRSLAKTVLVDLGVAERFDVYLTRGADQTAGGPVRNLKLHRWLQGLWIQELGWTKVEEAYLAHFEAKFSEAELRELLALSKSPTVKKLLNAEVEAFRSTFEARNQIFGIFWLRYNSMEFSPPPEALK